jgi:hypothetical protein
MDLNAYFFSPSAIEQRRFASRPNFFELIASEQLQQSLRPAVKYLLAVRFYF